MLDGMVNVQPNRVAFAAQRGVNAVKGIKGGGAHLDRARAGNQLMMEANVYTTRYRTGGLGGLQQVDPRVGDGVIQRQL